MNAAASNRILVIGPTWIGDMVMAQCLFKALKRHRPGCTLDVLGPPWAPALLARMPQVDNAMPADIAHGELALGARWRIGRRLRKNHYEQAFVTSRSLKSALIPWFARVPRRTGYRGEPRRGLVNDTRELNTTDLKQKAQHYVALSLDPDEPPAAAANIELPELAIDRDNRDTLIARYGLSLQRPVVALAPGAAHGPAKRWPAARYAMLARELADRGFECWIFGSDADAASGREIASAAPRWCVDFCGKTRLVDVIDLMSLADTVVGNDTGLTHLGAGVVQHVVGLYGSTHPEYAPPLCRKPVSLWLDLSCSPCKAQVCPLGHTLCLHDIPVADVVRACVAPDDSGIASCYRPG